MPKKQAETDKAVKKVEKAVRKALKKGANVTAVEQAVKSGIDRPSKRKALPPKKGAASVEASDAPKAAKKAASVA